MKYLFSGILSLILLISSATFVFAATTTDGVCGPQVPDAGRQTVIRNFTPRAFAGRGGFGLGKEIPKGTIVDYTSSVCDHGITYLAVEQGTLKLWLPDTWPNAGRIWGKEGATATSNAGVSCQLWGQNLAISGNTVRVLTGCLNIRSGAGTNFSVIGKAFKNSLFTWIESNATQTWYSIRTETGLTGWMYGPPLSVKQ